MSHSELSLKYDGPSVDDGSMDVRDLAPALLAVGNLIEAASRVVNGPGATPRVQVKTVAPGSFTVGLDVTVDFLQSIRDMLISPDGSAAANLITILTGSLAAGGGAIALVRWLGGKRPTRISKQAEHKVEVELDGKTIIVDEIVARVAIDVKVRLAMERVIAEPLSKEGIESVEIGKGAATERVEKKDGHIFVAPPDTEGGDYEYRFRAPFSIISVTFKEGNKWRLHDGKVALSVTVTDTAYLARVDRSEISFAKGDVLICDVKVIARQEGKGLKSEYFIERVVEHRHPEQQSSFFPSPEFGPSGNPASRSSK